MYLLLGHYTDSCIHAVSNAIDSLGNRAIVLDNILGQTSTFNLRIETDRTAGFITYLDEVIHDVQIEGVFVRQGPWTSKADWDIQDWEYAQSETQAAFIAWLLSLTCPVVNRPRAEFWYGGSVHISAWHTYLQRAGLKTLPSVVSNDLAVLRGFDDQRGGCILTPLSSNDQFPIANETDWNEIARMAKLMPVCLTQPHTTPYRVYVVRHDVIWEGLAPSDTADINDKLVRFLSIVGLDWAMLHIVISEDDWRVLRIDFQPDLTQTPPEIFSLVVQRLVNALLDRDADAPHGTAITRLPSANESIVDSIPACPSREPTWF